MHFRHTLLAVLALLAAAAFAQQSASTSTSTGTFSGSVRFTGVAPAASRPLTGAPYSADQTNETVQTLADGTHVTHASPIMKYYRDSAGRTRTERSAGPMMRHADMPDAPVIVEIQDPVAHVRYVLDTANKIAHRQTAAGQTGRPVTTAPNAHAAPAQEAPKTTVEKLGIQTMEGVTVQGTRRTIVWPAGTEGSDRPITVVREEWWSPELKLDVLTTRNDPRSGESTTKLTNISRDEPDPSLFQPPADYTIVDETGDFQLKWGSAR